VQTEQIKGTSDTYKKYIPVITAICCLVSIVLFIGINAEPGKLDDWEIYKKWGAPSETDIFGGSYWGLITSNFLHTEIWHIGFNLYWFWIFGKKIEFETSKLFFATFILTSALISSAAELSFADTTGIGLSGIGYSLFGFLFIKSKTTEQYRHFLDRATIIQFVIWLVLCVILTQTNAWSIGNAAHIAGLFWGITVAYIAKFRKYIQWATGIGLLSIVTSSIFWSPFSTSWLSHRAYELHNSQKTEEAIELYKKILVREPDNEFAKVNLRQIEIEKLEDKAYEFHLNKKYSEARDLYNQILKMDKDNSWARENLNMLPK
jgi:membrane associated rhomboid family serine protease